jgi:hypothetical protein
VGSNPAEGDAYLWVIKIHGMPSFREEARPSAPYHKVLEHVKKPFKV